MWGTQFAYDVGLHLGEDRFQTRAVGRKGLGVEVVAEYAPVEDHLGRHEIIPAATFPIIMRWCLIQIAQNIGEMLLKLKRCAK